MSVSGSTRVDGSEGSIEDAVMTGAPTGTRLRLPTGFVLWAGAAAVSDVGVSVLYIALGWTASAHGGTAAGLVIAVITATRTTLLLVGGAVADRLGARAVMLIGDAGLLVATAAFAVAALLIGTPLWLLLLIAFVEGVVSAFYMPASSSLPRRLVSDVNIGRATAVRGVGSELAELTGAPIGGLLVATGGFAVAVGVDALTYVPVLLVMLTLRPRRAESGGIPSAWRRDLFEGVALVVRDPLLRVALALIAVVAATFVPVGAVLIPLVVRAHGWTASSTGVILAGLAIGGIAVGTIVGRVGTARATIAVASAGLLVTATALYTLGLDLPLTPLVVAATAAGAGIALFTGHVIPLVLQRSPETHLSRVMAVLSLVQAAILVIAAPLFGSIATATDPSVALTVAAATLAVATLIALLSPNWRKERQHATTPTSD